MSCYIFQWCFSCFTLFLRALQRASTHVASAAVYLKTCFTISLHPFLRSERKQDYLNPGQTYVREPAHCLCCSSNPPAGMWICQDDRQPLTYLSGPPFLALSALTTHLCLSVTPLTRCRQDLGIPAVTQELPPLLSAFFSSRSESQTSFGPNPRVQGGRLYGSYHFHEIGI